MIREVLTVCVGNICRSPAAESLLSAQLSGLSVSSAGLGALVGNGVDPTMARILAEDGLDVSAHRARALQAWMTQRSDLILVMEQAHKTQIESTYPAARGRVFRLGHYLDADIADPYREDEAFFRSTYDRIQLAVEQWVARIRRIGYEAKAA